MAKELEHLKINLPDKFVVGGIIAKLPPSWRDFATTLKHKRMEISVSNLIASLDVEKKARTMNGRSKATKVQTTANMVQKSHGKGKGKGKKTNRSLPLLSRRRSSRKVKAILCVDLLIIRQRSAHTTKEGSLDLSRRLRIRSPWLEWKPVGIILYLQFFQYFNLLVGGLILVQMFMCVLMLPCFFLPDHSGFYRDDGQRVACYYSWCWHGRSEANFEKDRAAEERAACPYYRQESS
jgi:hypothetical protein